MMAWIGVGARERVERVGGFVWHSESRMGRTRCFITFNVPRPPGFGMWEIVVVVVWLCSSLCSIPTLRTPHCMFFGGRQSPPPTERWSS
jgi:hypothetical protein